jgi:hypothetical protein
VREESVPNHTSLMEKLNCLCCKKKKKSSLSWEQLLGSVTKDVLLKMDKNRNDFVFKVCLLCMTTNFLSQVELLPHMLAGGFYFGILYQWSFFFALCFLAFKFQRGNKQMIYPLIHLITIR